MYDIRRGPWLCHTGAWWRFGRGAIGGAAAFATAVDVEVKRFDDDALALELEGEVVFASSCAAGSCSAGSSRKGRHPAQDGGADGDVDEGADRRRLEHLH